jgi:hypothetical protein
MIEWSKCDPAVDRSAVTEIEHGLGVRFPEDYVQCVLIKGGGRPWPNGVRVGDGETVFNTLFNFNMPHAWQAVTPGRLIDRYASLTSQKLLPPKTYPFANDPGGNYFAFDYHQSATAPAIVFLDHESQDADGHFETSFVAHSFTEMLDQMFKFEDDADPASGGHRRFDAFLII